MSYLDKKIDISDKRKLTLNLTTGDWQLYSSMEGSSDAAASINKEIASIFNKCKKKSESAAHEAINDVLVKYREFGASDSEPRHVAEDLVGILRDQQFFLPKPRDRSNSDYGM